MIIVLSYIASEVSIYRYIKTMLNWYQKPCPVTTKSTIASLAITQNEFSFTTLSFCIFLKIEGYYDEYLISRLMF